MSAKAYRRVYAVVMTILAIMAVGFGVLCFRYDYLPEGIIVIGAVLVIATITFALHATQANAERELLLANAGPAIVELSGIAHVGTNKGEECLMYLRKNGVVIDTKDVEFDLIRYEEIKVISIDNTGICLQIPVENDVTSIRLVCNKPLKIKAAQQTLMKHGCELLAV